METFYGSCNLTGKPRDVSPTMRVMPYTGRQVDIGEPDLNAGNGGKRLGKSPVPVKESV